MNNNEKKFALFLTKHKLQYIYQPRVEALKTISYTPDFFVLQNATYYEVIGSRQAFSQNRKKILIATTLVNLKIVTPNGELYNFQKRRKPTEDCSTTIKRGIMSKQPFDWHQFLYDLSLDRDSFLKKVDITPPTFASMLRDGVIRFKYVLQLKSLGIDLMKYMTPNKLVSDTESLIKIVDDSSAGTVK